jgi:hypothetical protein
MLAAAQPAPAPTTAHTTAAIAVPASSSTAACPSAAFAASPAKPQVSD